MRLRLPARVTRRGDAADEGSVYVLALVMVIIGGLICTGLLGFASAVLRATPPVHARTVAGESAKSGVRMAITMQREVGPKSCFAPTATWEVNGTPVTVTCTTDQVYSTGSGRYGVIVTGTSTDDWHLRGEGTGDPKDIDGAVFLNGGRVGGPTADLLVKDAEITFSNAVTGSAPAARYWTSGTTMDCTDPALAATAGFASGTSLITGAAHGHTFACTSDPWWARAGDNPNGTGWSYPTLPPLPTYERPGSQASIGSCRVYYPGRYLGTQPLVLDGGTHYFASGVYYFERSLVIRNGATVVAGEGRFPGCTFDADAAFAPTAPRSHEITGKGATFVLGGSATVTVERSALRMNRRVSTAGTRGSEGTSIRAVSFGVDTPEVQVPGDVVSLADGSTVPASAHSIRPTPTSPPVSYRPSTVPAVGAAILDVRLDGPAVSTNQLMLDGAVFVPGAPVQVRTGGTSYVLRMTGGIVTSHLALEVPLLPSGGAAAYTVGVVTEPIQRKVVLRATATADGQTATSTAVLEVNEDRSYAINSWIVDV